MQLELPGMNEHTQLKLARAHVLILGLGGPGAVAARFLVGAGVGVIGILDDKEVGITEIYKQVLASGPEIGKMRVQAAERILRSINPDSKICCHTKTLNAHEAEVIFGQYDLIIDGLDDWQTKLLASDTCMHLGAPLIHAGITGYRFQVYTMVPGRSACLRCVFHQIGMEDLAGHEPAPPPLGAAVGMAGALQSSEAVQLITDVGVAGFNELIQFDCLRREFDSVQELTPRPDCPDCGRWSVQS